MSSIHENLTVEELINAALERGEGEIASNGALLVKTGKRTGRSPLDRFIVKDDATINSVDWGQVNKPFDSEAFINIWNRVEEYMNERDTFVRNLRNIGMICNPTGEKSVRMRPSLSVTQEDISVAISLIKEALHEN